MKRIYIYAITAFALLAGACSDNELNDDAPVIPATHGPVKSKNCVIQKVGDILRLKEMETFHFMMAGPEGAVVCEWANYHDNAGLRFTHPTATL